MTMINKQGAHSRSRMSKRFPELFSSVLSYAISGPQLSAEPVY